MQVLKESTSYRLSLKDKILQVAMKAFIEHGVKAVKMDDIASQVGISKRTLYEIYDDKEELLFQGVSYYDGQREKQFRDFVKKADNVMDIILELYRLKVNETRSVTPLFYVDIRKYPKILRYMEEKRERSRGELSKFFLRGLHEGYFRKDINYQLAVHLFDAIGQYIMKHMLIETFSFEELFNNMLLVSLRGLCTMKGIKVMDEAVASYGRTCRSFRIP